MYKHPPSRSHRSRGIKGKHILQFCVLLVVCIWLIYQVKHSHNKRKQFEVKDDKFLETVKTDNEIERLGRKDLPRVTEMATDVEKLVEDEDEKEPEEEENKHSMNEPEREAIGVEERDLKEPQQTEAEPEHEEEQVNDVKDGEENEEGSEENQKEQEEGSDDDNTENEGDERALEEHHAENEENEGGSEEKHTENEDQEGESEENIAENEENEGGSAENNTVNEEHEEVSIKNHTENEENYDVTENHRETLEHENAETEHHTDLKNESARKENHDENDATLEDHDHEGGSTTTRKAQEELYKADDASSEVAQNVRTVISGTENLTTGHGNELWGNVNFGQQNETITSDKGEVSNNGTVSNATVAEEKQYKSNPDEADHKSLQNPTLPDLPKEQPANSSNSIAVNGERSATLLSDETQIREGSNKTEIVNTYNGESLSSSNTTSGGDDSSLNPEKKSENSGIADRSDENSEYQSSDESTDTIQHDPIDATDTDLDTLPEITTDVQNNDDSEAE